MFSLPSYGSIALSVVFFCFSDRSIKMTDTNKIALKRRSPIWEHVWALKDDPSSLICRHCDAVGVVHKMTLSTSSAPIAYHMKNAHPALAEPYERKLEQTREKKISEKKIDASTPKIASFVCSAKEKERLDQSLAKNVILGCLLPAHTTEHPCFRFMC